MIYSNPWKVKIEKWKTWKTWKLNFGIWHHPQKAAGWSFPANWQLSFNKDMRIWRIPWDFWVVFLWMVLLVPQEKMSEFSVIYVEIIFNPTGSGESMCSRLIKLNPMDPITFFSKWSPPPPQLPWIEVPARNRPWRPVLTLVTGRKVRKVRFFFEGAVLRDHGGE